MSRPARSFSRISSRVLSRVLTIVLIRPAMAVVAVAAAILVMVGWMPPATAVVSSTPAFGTPQLASTGVTEQVRQLVQCGGTMYAVGSFTAIKSHKVTYTRDNAFSFSATSPFTLTAWNPNVNGQVDSVALTPNCADAYIGGKFTTVGGTAVSDIAEVSTSTGAVVPGFAHSANGQVETLLLDGTHLFTGGYFTTVNGNANKYMASLNSTTGKDDGFIHLAISGNEQYCLGTKCSDPNPTRIYNQQLSPNGTLDLVEGDFTSVGGQPRQQVFMLNLSGTTATVSPWTSPEFGQHCDFRFGFYVRAGAWSPDGSEVYFATTGYRPYNFTSFPLTGLCDAASAFPTTQASVSHLWINYTGCDSLYSAVADSTTAYFAGHERWTENPNGCDHQGPGALSAPGIEGVSPTSGQLTFNPTRGRGLGADDMILTAAGLWIASDNFDGTSQCGGLYGYAGICFLPN